MRVEALRSFGKCRVSGLGWCRVLGDYLFKPHHLPCLPKWREEKRGGGGVLNSDAELFTYLLSQSINLKLCGLPDFVGIIQVNLHSPRLLEE